MIDRNLLIALTSTLLCVAACDAPASHDTLPDASDDDEQQFRTTYGSGSGANPPVYGNTCAIGDHPLSELDSTGKPHAGTRLIAVHPWDPVGKTLMATSFTSVWVEDDGEIRARRGAMVYSGSALQGSRWTIEVVQDGVPVVREMTIHDYNHDPVHDVHRYVLAYPNDPSYGPHLYNNAVPSLAGDRRSACVPDVDGNIEAVMLSGYHVDLTSSQVTVRDNTLAFACLSGAMGKALRWGYRPHTEGLDGRAYEAAIRMVRADYCGDGVSWTEPGQEIDIADRWGVNDWRNAAQFDKTEAMWGSSGAICLGTPRLKGQFTASDIVCPQGPLPTCDSFDESDPFEEEGVIWTRVSPL